MAKKRFSATKASLALLRLHGYESEVVERWNPFARVRHDLFGFADIVALRDRIVAVQTTTYKHAKARAVKIMREPRAERWLIAGGRIAIHGWKRTKRFGSQCFVFNMPWTGHPTAIIDWPPRS